MGPDLDLQFTRVTAWAVARDLPVGRVEAEVGSALGREAAQVPCPAAR